MDEKNIIATKHGTQRTKERLGLSKKSAADNAAKALQFGLTHAETKGNLRRYLDKLYLSVGKGCIYRVYHRSIYVFQNNRLITVMTLPQKLNKLADSLQEQKKTQEDLQEQGGTVWAKD